MYSVPLTTSSASANLSFRRRPTLASETESLSSSLSSHAGAFGSASRLFVFSCDLDDALVLGWLGAAIVKEEGGVIDILESGVLLGGVLEAEDL